MARLNKVMMIGNLGADPEMRFTANGQAVANFNVACNRSLHDSRRRTTRRGYRVGHESSAWQASCGDLRAST